MKIIVSRLELQAALLFASQDDCRYTLNAVCIEATWGRRPTIIATDGRRLAVIESQAEQEEEFDGTVSILLRADFVKPVCALSRAFGGKIFPWIAFKTEAGSNRVGVDFIGGHCFLEAQEKALVEGVFPDWRKCVPSKNAKRSQINDLGMNAETVGDFAKVAKIFDVDRLIQMNLVGKDSAVEVKIPRAPYFYGLVMPCKIDEDVDYQPEFLGIVKDLPVRSEEEQKPEEPAGESDDDATVTISSGDDSIKPVKMTMKQFSGVAKILKKKAK